MGRGPAGVRRAPARAEIYGLGGVCPPLPPRSSSPSSVLGVTCWVIGSDDGSDRVTRMIYARHGEARSAYGSSRKLRRSASPYHDAAGTAAQLHS